MFSKHLVFIALVETLENQEELKEERIMAWSTYHKSVLNFDLNPLQSTNHCILKTETSKLNRNIGKIKSNCCWIYDGHDYIYREANTGPFEIIVI